MSYHRTPINATLALLFSIGLARMATAQMIGTTQSGGETPSEVKPASLTPSVLQGDVDLFTGTYSASYPLGTVSTPGGLSYSLALQYNPAITGGSTPTLQDGIPYGQGWSLNVPTITVSNAYVHHLTRAEEKAIAEATDDPPTGGVTYNEDASDSAVPAVTDGYGVWYAPTLNIPGVASGRMVFKHFGNDGAIFVLNTFDQYIEAHFSGSTWEVYTSDGKVYSFGETARVVQMPGNKRWVDYQELTDLCNDEGEQGGTKLKILNAIRPREHTLVWSCVSISDPIHAPVQFIRFGYEGYGLFDMTAEMQQAPFWEFLALELRPNDNQDITFWNPLNGYPQLTTYQEVLLKKITATSLDGDLEVLELDYKVETPGPGAYMVDDITANPSLDAMYRGQVVERWGSDPLLSETNEPFTDWRRYLHYAHPDRTSMPQGFQVNSIDPYVGTVNGQQQYFSQGATNLNDPQPFYHGYLESPGTQENKIYPGDLWEIRTIIADGGSDANFDINLVTGIGELDEGAVLDQAYRTARRTSLFSTFDRMIKWNTYGLDVLRRTSNVFAMPYVENDDNNGIHIQVGPGNSDTDYGMGTGNDLDDLSIQVSGVTKPAAYKSYYHAKWESYMDADQNGNPAHGLMSHDPIPHNFGIGLPWSSLLRVHERFGNYGYLPDDPTTAGGMQKWWSNGTSMPWTNVPTFAGGAALQRVELIRYGKQPYMLQFVKKWVRQGTQDLNDPLGMTEVQQLAMSYAALEQPIPKRFKQVGATGSSNEPYTRRVFELIAIKEIPRYPSTDGTIAGPTDLVTPTTRFGYMNARDLVTAEPITLHCSTMEIALPSEREQIVATGRVLNTVSDPLGQVTTIDYNDPYDPTLTHMALHVGDHPGLVIVTDVEGTTGDQCDDRVTLIPGTASITPTVAALHRSDESDETARTWTYTYANKRAKHSAMPISDLSCYRHTRHGTLNYGFKNVSVEGPDLGTDVRVKREYEFHVTAADASYTLTVPTSGWPPSGEPISELSLDWPPTDIDEEDYHLWGRLKKQSIRDPEDNLLETTETVYDVLPAYLNGVLRNSEGRRLHSGREYEYIDFHPDFDLSQGPASVNNVLNSQGFYPGPEFLEYHNPSDPNLGSIKYHVDFPPEYLNSYFIRKTKETHTVYDPEGCAIPATTAPDPDDPAEMTNPHSTGYANSATTTNASAIITALDQNGLTEQLKDDLIAASPLQESVLEKAIAVADAATAKRLLLVLQAQGQMSDARLLQVLDKANTLGDWLVADVLMQQPWHTDAVLGPLLTSTVLASTQKTALLLKQERISTSVQGKLLDATTIVLAPAEMERVLRAQPPLTMALLEELVENTAMPPMNTAAILAAQPWLKQTVLEAIEANLATWPADALEEVLVHGHGTPTEAFYTELLEHTPAYPSEVLRNILGASPTPFSNDLRIAIGSSNVLHDDDKDPLLNNTPSALLQSCGNGCTTTELKMRTVTDYEYYEADPAGRSSAPAWRSLLGLENATLVPVIQLKWDPSWLPYRVRTSSPEYPGAFTEHEYFYLQDLRNRFDRHWETIIANDQEFFDWTTEPQDGYPAEENFGISIPKVFYEGNGPFEYNFDVDGPENEDLFGQYKPPVLEILDKMKVWGFRTDKIYQHRVTSRENRDTVAVQRSEFFHYTTRWNWEDVMTFEVIEEDIPCENEPFGIDMEGDNFWSPFTKFHHITAENWKDHIDAVPAGYSLVRSRGGHYGVAPSALEPQNHGYELLHENEEEPEEGGDPKMAPFAALMNDVVLLRDVYTQADETILQNYVDGRLFTESHPLMSFQQLPPESNELFGEWVPLLPFECIRDQHITVRNWFCQPALIENERGLLTRINYSHPILHQYTESMEPCSMYVFVELNNPGLPLSITVGEGLSNAQTTNFTYAQDLSLASITDPNGIALTYQYDGLGRLWKSSRNSELLGVNLYHQWANPANGSWGTGEQFARTQENWTESYMRRERDSNAGLRTRSYVDPNGRGAATLTAPMVDITDDDETIPDLHVSGLQLFDRWDRALKVFKPDLRTNGTGNDAFALTTAIASTTSLAFAEADHEDDHRSRPLFNAAPGETLSGHTRKMRYRFINYIAFACDLNLSAVEAGMLMPGTTSNYVWTRTETEDEDGNTARSYTNALGQQVATASIIDGSTKAITLFLYDDQGALARVINPQKQHTTYAQNILGWTYKKNTVDGGATKYLYDVSGNVVLEQDANGAVGEPDANILLDNQPTQRPWYRRTSYDIFNRPTKQERLRLAHPATLNYGDECIYSFPIDLLAHQDHLLDFSDGNAVALCWPSSGAEPSACWHHRFSSASTLDWLTRWEVLRRVPGSGGSSILPVVVQYNDLLADPLLEKTWNYDFGAAISTEPQLDPATIISGTTGLLSQQFLGRLMHTVSYPHHKYADITTSIASGVHTWHGEEHTPVLYDFRSYDDEGNTAWQLQQFNAKGITTNDMGRELRLDYPSYDLLGNLRTVNVDVHNDGQLDMQQHHTYDAWGRLAKVYLNVNDEGANGNQIASFEYDLVRGLLDETTYYADDCASPGQPDQVDVMAYTYDVRDRLTAINGAHYDEALHYDASMPTHAMAGQLAGDEHFNGSINGLEHSYALDGTIGYDGVAFENPTQYAFSYDGVGRMIAADAVQGDLVLGASAATDPLFRVGDEAYTFDRIGNLRNVQRHGFFTATPTDVEQVIWTYQYAYGKSRLANVLAGAGSALPNRAYQYDAAGNLTTDVYRQHLKTVYGRAQLPFAVTLGNTDPHTANYLYDAADHRVYKRERDENGALVSEAFHLRDAAGRELGVWDKDTHNSAWTWYGFGGQRFAKATPLQQPDPNATQGGGEPFTYTNAYGTNGLKYVGFYVQDHLGNTRVTYSAGCDGANSTRSLALEHVADYYPYGTILREYVENRAERYLTTLHERDQETGLDYRGARFYDSDVARFLSLEPLADQYASWSAYNYVMGNPISLSDPTGMSASNDVTKNEDGTYSIVQGVGTANDGDRGIYVVGADGKRTGEVIGQSLTTHSFFNDDGSAASGAVINKWDRSGMHFLNAEIITNTPDLLDYMQNATGGELYDFKRRNMPANLDVGAQLDFMYRGMPFEGVRGFRDPSGKGGTTYASARDIGNVGAGFMAGLNGYNWNEARLVLDGLESVQWGRIATEAMPTQLAQLVGLVEGARARNRR